MHIFIEADFLNLSSSGGGYKVKCSINDWKEVVDKSWFITQVEEEEDITGNTGFVAWCHILDVYTVQYRYFL